MDQLVLNAQLNSSLLEDQLHVPIVLLMNIQESELLAATLVLELVQHALMLLLVRLVTPEMVSSTTTVLNAKLSNSQLEEPTNALLVLMASSQLPPLLPVKVVLLLVQPVPPQRHAKLVPLDLVLTEPLATSVPLVSQEPVDQLPVPTVLQEPSRLLVLLLVLLVPLDVPPALTSVLVRPVMLDTD